MTTTQTADGFDKAAQARGRRLLLGVAALFFVPLALSFWLYYAGGWRPGTTNKGELITPARPLENVPFTLPDGTTSARADLFKNKWTLLYFGAGRCATEDCRHALWVMRQTRQLLAADIDRVQRVFIARNECCDLDFLAKEHAGLEVVRADDPSTADFFAQFPSQDQATSIYVVDPLGNLMMRWDTRENPKGLLSDMKKLLKLSHIG